MQQPQEDFKIVYGKRELKEFILAQNFFEIIT